jgi:deazaflavin-dependent oxidoreductase (nitroreductase family)
MNPLVCQASGDRFVVFASNGGAPQHPDWYHNLVANPHAAVEIGMETLEVTARVTEGRSVSASGPCRSDPFPHSRTTSSRPAGRSR